MEWLYKWHSIEIQHSIIHLHNNLILEGLEDLLQVVIMEEIWEMQEWLKLLEEVHNLILIAVEDILVAEEEARVEILATNVINQVIGQVNVLKLLAEEVVNHMVVVAVEEEAVNPVHNVIIVMK